MWLVPSPEHHEVLAEIGALAPACQAQSRFLSLVSIRREHDAKKGSLTCPKKQCHCL